MVVVAAVAVDDARPADVLITRVGEEVVTGVVDDERENAARDGASLRRRCGDIMLSAVLSTCCSVVASL